MIQIILHCCIWISKVIKAILMMSFFAVDWLPIVRELVAIGVTMMNLTLSISLSLTVIAIGWIAYRPLMGIAILAMATTPFFMAKFKSRGAHSHSSYE